MCQLLWLSWYVFWYKQSSFWISTCTPELLDRATFLCLLPSIKADLFNLLSAHEGQPFHHLHIIEAVHSYFTHFTWSLIHGHDFSPWKSRAWFCLELSQLQMENVIFLSVILSVNWIQIPLSYHRLFEEACLTQLSSPSPEFSICCSCACSTEGIS